MTFRYRGEVPAASARSIVLCPGMGLPADELVAELLVRILRGSRIDARHIKDEHDLDSLHVYGIATLNIDAVCMVTMTAPEAPEHGVELAKNVEARACRMFVRWACCCQAASSIPTGWPWPDSA